MMSVFEQIDKDLGKKSKKERYMMYMMIVVVIGFLFYYFVFPKAEKFYNAELTQNNRLKDSIRSKNTDILKVRREVLQANAKIKLLEKHIEKLNKENAVLQKETSKLSFAKFDSTKWAKLLKDSVMEAIKKGIEVKLVSSNVENVNGYLKCFAKQNVNLLQTKNNSKMDLSLFTKCNGNKQKFKFINKKLTFTLSMKSSYKNLLLYMYGYENTKELFRIESLSIKPGKYLLQISLYGYEK